MEEELNYLSDKIECLDDSIEKNIKKIEVCRNTDLIEIYSNLKKQAEKEKEILENIINLIKWKE